MAPLDHPQGAVGWRHITTEVRYKWGRETPPQIQNEISEVDSGSALGNVGGGQDTDMVIRRNVLFFSSTCQKPS